MTHQFFFGNIPCFTVTACSPVLENTTSCSNDKSEHVDVAQALSVKTMLKEELCLSELVSDKWELTWEEKVMEVLHIVRCHEFTE